MWPRFRTRASCSVQSDCRASHPQLSPAPRPPPARCLAPHSPRARGLRAPARVHRACSAKCRRRAGVRSQRSRWCGRGHGRRLEVPLRAVGSDVPMGPIISSVPIDAANPQGSISSPERPASRRALYHPVARRRDPGHCLGGTRSGVRRNREEPGRPVQAQPERLPNREQ